MFLRKLVLTRLSMKKAFHTGSHCIFSPCFSLKESLVKWAYKGTEKSCSNGARFPFLILASADSLDRMLVCVRERERDTFNTAEELMFQRNHLLIQKLLCSSLYHRQ